MTLREHLEAKGFDTEGHAFLTVIRNKSRGANRKKTFSYYLMPNGYQKLRRDGTLKRVGFPRLWMNVGSYSLDESLEVAGPILPDWLR